MGKAFRTLIDARFDRLEQNIKGLETEWSDVYDKMMLLYDRTRKRIAAAKKASDVVDVPEPAQAIPQTRDDVLRAFLARNGGD